MTFPPPGGLIDAARPAVPRLDRFDRLDGEPEPGIGSGRAGAEEARHDSLRVFVGQLALLVLSVGILNFVLYQNARSSLAQQQWAELSRKADAKRSQVRSLFHHLESLARYVAEGPALSTWARATMTGTLAPQEQQQLEQELNRAGRGFRLEYLAILSPEGVWLAGTQAEQISGRVHHSRLALDASEATNRVRGDIRLEAGGSGIFEVAVPMAAASLGGRVPVLLLAADAGESLLPLLTGWSDVETGGHAYLVRASGSEVQFLTSPDPRGGIPEALLAPMGASSARAAAMAASGLESSVEFRDARGHSMCAVTRVLPELGWGMVAQTERRFMMAPMRGVALRLLALDLALAACAAVIFWLWRRQYEKGLARTEIEVTHRHAARVQAILDTAFDGVLTFDRDGRMRTVNRAAEHLFGRAVEEMIGQPIHRFLRWGGTAGHATDHELPPPGVVCGGECLRGDGTSFPAEFSLGRSGEGADLLYTVIVRDMRDRVEAERQIREFAEGLEATNRRLEEVNAQLEEGSRLKSEFLANTSHELRTPLNGMIGFLQLVLDGMCESREEETDFLKQALQCSRHLLGLINDVLDIARIESGKLQVEIERVDIETLFQDVHTVTHVQAAQKGITLRFEPPVEGVAARCDMAKTKQVLINLVGNSLKFTPKGSITVRSAAHPELGHVMFEVVDTGIGIPREKQALIFEKFAQGDGSTTRKYGGTGLGLAISRSLVELMGGIIGVYSEGAGKGTRMFFSLPIWADEAMVLEGEETVPERIEGTNGPLVLVVEDDPVFRRFITALLNRHGYRTAQAESAEAGWLLVRRLKPATVILDYALTCGEGARLRTGWDLAERLASDPETRHVPFVFVTGFDDQVRERLQRTALAQKPKHLVKPIDGAALVAAIEDVVGGIEGRQVRILMADDDPSVAAFVRKVLPEGRFHIEVASNGEECLHILRTQPRGFDLLLLDLMMPGVSGYDVLRQMALSGASGSLPVLVLTNYPEPRNEDERQLLKHGMVLDIVAKTAVHENPSLLAHVVEWHVQVAGDHEGLGKAA